MSGRRRAVGALWERWGRGASCSDFCHQPLNSLSSDIRPSCSPFVALLLIQIASEDEVVFYGLLGDLFPGLNPEREMDLTLKQCCEHACETLKLVPDDFFVLKCVQMEALLQIRHCVFVMGPPGSGKSQCWKTLQLARGLQVSGWGVYCCDFRRLPSTSYVSLCRLVVL